MLLILTLNLLTTTIVAPPSNASKWQMGFNSAFKGLREGHWRRVVENMVVRKKFGLKWDEVTGDWRKLHSEKLHDLRAAPDIKEIDKGR